MAFFVYRYCPWPCSTPAFPENARTAATALDLQPLGTLPGGFRYQSNAGLFTHKGARAEIIASAVIQMIMTRPLHVPGFYSPALDDLGNTRHHDQPVNNFTPPRQRSFACPYLRSTGAYVPVSMWDALQSFLFGQLGPPPPAGAFFDFAAQRTPSTGETAATSHSRSE